MSKVIERGRAITLRRDGYSYGEILRHVPVAKSTLSLWLRSVGLSKKQKQHLTEKKLLAIERGWTKIKNRRIEKCKEIRETSLAEAKEFVKDPLWLVGTVLYWAEGGKEKIWRIGERVSFSNMD